MQKLAGDLQYRVNLLVEDHTLDSLQFDWRNLCCVEEVVWLNTAIAQSVDDVVYESNRRGTDRSSRRCSLSPWVGLIH